MQNIIDGIKTTEDANKFVDNPEDFIKGKIKDAAKNSLKKAAFGEKMSPEMSNVFVRVSQKHDANPLGGACPMAAHGNASNILFDLKYQGQTMWFFETCFDIIGSIISVQKSMGEFLKDKTKKQVEKALIDYFDSVPPETFSQTGTKQGCDYSVVASIDYSRKTYEVGMIANCKCQPIRIPLRKGSGVVRSWKLYASGGLEMNVNDNFVKATIGRVKKYAFIPDCNCTDETASEMFEGGSGVHVDDTPEDTIEEPVIDCDELAKLIAETEKKMFEIRHMISELRNRSGGQGNNSATDNMIEEEISNLNSDYSFLANFLGGLLMEWNENCSSNTNAPKLSPEELIYFKNALWHFASDGYRTLPPKEQNKLDDKIKKAKKEGTSHTDEKVGSSWIPQQSESKVAVIGTVRDEEVLITSRGTIGGKVIMETEDEEKLAEITPNENDQFMVNFKDFAESSAEIIFKLLDANGDIQSTSTVNYIPGQPEEVIGKPMVHQPEIPYFENHQLYEIEGLDFSKDAEVIVKGESGNAILQETVSSSTSLNKFYLDGNVGSAELSVRNKFGDSEPIDIDIYEVEVRTGKMNLNRSEKTYVSANYEGLPEGTNIVFTNMSSNVKISPSGKGKASGNEVKFTVKESVGEVSINVKALQTGDWIINYRLEFPSP